MPLYFPAITSNRLVKSNPLFFLLIYDNSHFRSEYYELHGMKTNRPIGYALALLNQISALKII